MLYLYLGDILINPIGGFSLVNKISDQDTLAFNFLHFPEFVLKNYLVTLKEDEKVVFKGILSTQSIGQNQERNYIECVAFGLISKLDNCLVHSKRTFTGELTDLMNTNNQGIVFKKYDPTSRDLFVNTKLEIKTYLNLLDEIRAKLGVQYYYNYQDDCVYLGVPDGGINQTDQIELTNLTEKVLQLPTVATVDYTKIYNQISVLSSTQNTLGLENTTISDPAYPVITKPDLVFPAVSYTCIVDAESQTKYGVKEEFIRGLNLKLDNTVEDKINGSNYAYNVCLDKIKKTKDPKYGLTNFSYKCDTSHEVNPFKIFNADFEILGVAIKGKYLIDSITRDFTKLANTGVHDAKIQLTSYIDKEYDKTNSYFDELKGAANDQVAFATQVINILSANNKYTYSVDPTFKTVDIFKLKLTYVSPTTDLEINQVLIDGLDLTAYFTPSMFVGSSPPCYFTTNEFDLHNSSIPLTTKNKLETAGLHTIEVKTSQNISLQGTITISGYK